MELKADSAWAVQVGIGKGRDQWEIKKFLSERGLTIAGEAHKCGVHPSTANKTARGIQNNKKFLAHMESIGCPKEILYKRLNHNKGEKV